MSEAEVQDLFRKFALPLGSYVPLGAGPEATWSMAKSLWTAMIAGPRMEEELWRTLQETSALDDVVIESVRTCYREQMKPLVTDAELSALRERYAILPKA